ncbi:uncharacterized protein BDR25DRAFT_359859 [Lindgomyces ingoldianus]|uniref:Uncharacterized protein n=1 Tax=Lindgomyces ingoldianus TaxID=673940 RepID=A0ACB6QGF0_9PLEO|nr:uncharacterized protein BDR25DRAFT_359859 [Lindgomyces ingoldianus]KAF2466069.1 hypothetical protein BDR25DRAFT_359859 [Lindgomyces ingoldianus]
MISSAYGRVSWDAGVWLYQPLSKNSHGSGRTQITCKASCRISTWVKYDGRRASGRVCIVKGAPLIIAAREKHHAAPAAGLPRGGTTKNNQNADSQLSSKEDDARDARRQVKRFHDRQPKFGSPEAAWLALDASDFSRGAGLGMKLGAESSAEVGTGGVGLARPFSHSAAHAEIRRNPRTTGELDLTPTFPHHHTLDRHQSTLRSSFIASLFCRDACTAAANRTSSSSTRVWREAMKPLAMKSKVTELDLLLSCLEESCRPSAFIFLLNATLPFLTFTAKARSEVSGSPATSASHKVPGLAKGSRYISRQEEKEPHTKLHNGGSHRTPPAFLCSHKRRAEDAIVRSFPKDTNFAISSPSKTATNIRTHDGVRWNARDRYQTLITCFGTTSKQNDAWVRREWLTCKFMPESLPLWAIFFKTADGDAVATRQLSLGLFFFEGKTHSETNLEKHSVSKEKEDIRRGFNFWHVSTWSLHWPSSRESRTAPLSLRAQLHQQETY